MGRFRILIYLLAALSAFGSDAFARGRNSLGGSVQVRGYTRSNGTYVAPHYRSAPNSTNSDNWSTRGNYNPYTGETGRKNDDSGYSNREVSPGNAATSMSAAPQSIPVTTGYNQSRRAASREPSAYGGGVFSRIAVGSGQFSLSLDGEDDGGRDRISSTQTDIPSTHWDIVGFRGDYGLDFVIFVPVFTQ